MFCHGWQRISEASKEWYSYMGSELETKPRNCLCPVESARLGLQFAAHVGVPLFRCFRDALQPWQDIRAAPRRTDIAPMPALKISALHQLCPMVSSAWIARE